MAWVSLELYGRYASCWHEERMPHNDYCRFQVTRVDVTSSIAGGISDPGEAAVVTHSYTFESCLARDFVDKYNLFYEF